MKTRLRTSSSILTEGEERKKARNELQREVRVSKPKSENRKLRGKNYNVRDKRKEPQGKTRVQSTRRKKERKTASPEVQQASPTSQGGSPSSLGPDEGQVQSNAGGGEEIQDTPERQRGAEPVHQADPGSPGAEEPRGIQALDRPVMARTNLVSYGKPASLENRVVVVPPPLPIVLKYECITLSSDEEVEPDSRPPTDRQEASQGPRKLRLPPGITITRQRGFSLVTGKAMK